MVVTIAQALIPRTPSSVKMLCEGTHYEATMTINLAIFKKIYRTLLGRSNFPINAAWLIPPKYCFVQI